MVRHLEQPRLIFITGTDTGVGKTLLTALLLAHLRAAGCRAWALKPFCSGSRADARLLHALQDNELTLEQVNPFFFKQPVAPLVAARAERRRVRLGDALAHIRWAATRLGSMRGGRPGPGDTEGGRSSRPPASFLLVEGAGGLLAPLGEGFTLQDLMGRLAKPAARSSVPRQAAAKIRERPPMARVGVLLVARNQLGTINHTLLTVRALRSSAPDLVCVRRRAARHNPNAALSELALLGIVLMNRGAPDVSSRSNTCILAELLAPTPLVSVRFLGDECDAPSAVRAKAGRLEKLLSRMLE